MRKRPTRTINMQPGSTYIENLDCYNDHRGSQPKREKETIVEEKNVESGILAYVVNQEKSVLIIEELHQTYDKFKSSKERMAFIREAYKNKVFSGKIPFDVFDSEFGDIPKSTYSYWMKRLG